VRRFALAIIVALLAFSASGAVSLVRAEPCAANELARDNACPPTCVTCGCCARAAETVATVAIDASSGPLGEIPSSLHSLSTTAPRDILHVPKRRLS
jgi:hypothetical protein